MEAGHCRGNEERAPLFFCIQGDRTGARPATTGRSRLAYRAAAFFILALANATVSDVRADDTYDNSGYLTLQFDNDMFGGSDRHFTHGTRAAWLSPAGKTPEVIRNIATQLPFFKANQKMRISYSIGQNIFTPEDISRSDPSRDDRPYAGWLYAGIGLVAASDQRLDKLELDVGVVGPYSFADEVQTRWHDMIGITKPEGWGSQIRTEPGFALFYERSWRRLRDIDLTGIVPIENFGVDMTPHIGGALGNVFIHGTGGVTFRIGDDLRNDFGPPKLRPNLPGTDFFEPDDSIGWYLFAGGELRLVGRNIFLDGNTFRNSRRVNKVPVVADFQIGAAITFGRARFSYTQVFRTKEFEKQAGLSQFGSAAVSIRF